jgi:hypothetical protein
MSVVDWASFAVALGTIITTVALGIKWLVKHYLNELKPNGGSSMRDKVNQLEEKVDFLTDLVKEALKR